MRKTYRNIASAVALSYSDALNLAGDIDRDRYDGFSYQGDHGEECYVDFADTRKTYLMNTTTGSVDTKGNWKEEMKNWEGDAQEQFDSLVEVVRINDEWVEA